LRSGRFSRNERRAGRDKANMTMPRRIVPGFTYLVTRRCTQREFLLRPGDETNNAFIYCLALAAQLCGIDVHGYVASSNHYHSVVTDREGRLPAFLEYFHKLMAKHQNALFGRNENMWSSERTSVVQLVCPEDAMAKLVYTLANPVKDQLVEKVHHWPGAISYHACLHGKPITATKPNRFFRAGGRLKKEVQLVCVPLPGFDCDLEAYRRRLAQELDAVELAAAELREWNGSRVIGRKEILSQSHTDRPTSIRKKTGINPQIAALDPKHRMLALKEFRQFRCAYQTARRLWLSDKAHLFPFGTWWVARFAGANTEPEPPMGLGDQ
jgi:REP element-mobilizing transposase RayT